MSFENFKNEDNRVALSMDLKNKKKNKKEPIKFIEFTPYKGANRQKLPPGRKYVLVKLKNLNKMFPNPVVVGYLKYHAGVKSEPFFVTPGASIETPLGDEAVISWCDCLPDNFEWPKD